MYDICKLTPEKAAEIRLQTMKIMEGYTGKTGYNREFWRTYDRLCLEFLKTTQPTGNL